jgi:hypothetical protein
MSEVAIVENHLTELLDEPLQEAYSEVTCREPDARLMQVARHSGGGTPKAWLGRRAKLSGRRPG